MTKFLINFLAIILLGIIQVSFLSTWPSPVNGLNLILSVVGFLVASSYYRQGLLWAFGAGLFLELFNYNSFGLITLNLLITAVIINFLLNNFFTNHSFYSLTVLGLASVFVYYSLMLISRLVIFSFTGNPVLKVDAVFFIDFIWQSFLNLAVFYALFFTFRFLSRRFKINLPRAF